MNADDEPCTCGGEVYDEGGFGLAFCLTCGLGRMTGIGQRNGMFLHQDRLPGQQSYTRLKRFKKYMCRAMRQQSSSTVPRETWDYLLARRPYRDTQHIQRTLKRARGLKRKCYDSLPFLTAALCPHIEVPCLEQNEKQRAIHLFGIIDAAVRQGPFVSYLFCLEYILEKMGRSDMLPYINRIQCPKRRTAYHERLDKIFKNGEDPDIRILLRTLV